MPHEWDPQDPAADEKALALATRIRAGEGVDALLHAIAAHDHRAARRALQLAVELDRETVVDLTCEALTRLAALANCERAAG